MPNRILKIMLTPKDKRTGIDIVSLMEYWVRVIDAQELKFSLQIANLFK